MLKIDKFDREHDFVENEREIWIQEASTHGMPLSRRKQILWLPKHVCGYRPQGELVLPSSTHTILYGTIDWSRTEFLVEG